VSDLTIYLGSKNYSSWSLRAWLALRRVGVPFEEHVFDLTRDGVRDEIARHSASRLVPALRHGEREIWDSLAICEYLAETFPAAGLWPADPGARAVARAVSCEMHSGFVALRGSMPMNVRRLSPGKGRSEAVARDIDRIVKIWSRCRGEFGKGGRFLFGDWTIADCMYAPVVSRFKTYAVETPAGVADYVDSVLSWPDMVDWRNAAGRESAVNPAYDL
jgi:glutathione S-transferase